MERVVAVAFMHLTHPLKYINATAEVRRWFLKVSVFFLGACLLLMGKI